MAYLGKGQLFVLTWIYHVTSTCGLRVVDLTHTQRTQTIFYPGNPDYNFTVLFRGNTPQYWYEANAFSMAEHTGTHLDAPSHLAKDKLRVHQIPMEKLIGPGVIINVKTKVAADQDYRVTVADVNSWETKHGTIPNGAVVFMNSGWTDKYPNKTLAFGSDTPDDSTTYHFPGWHEDTVDWLVKNRNIHVLGVDTPSYDYGPSTSYPAHVILGTANIPAVENVANLDAIPESGTIIYVAVIKLFNGSGGPARVFATLPMDGVNGCALNRNTPLEFAILVSFLANCIF